jgi:hypothetical protein
MPLEREKIGSSGLYHNRAEHTYEAWAANGPAVENKHLLGACADDLPVDARRAWEHRVWTRLLMGGFNLPPARSSRSPHGASPEPTEADS